MSESEDDKGNGLELKQGYYLLNTDGGMESNGRRSHGDDPGEAAIGVVLMDPRMHPISTISRAIGPATNTVAEYQALIEGLRLARSHGIEHIRAYLDSEIVVDQVGGDSRVKQAVLRPLHEEACALAKDFRSFRISWVPREMNKEADALVSDALGR